MWTYKDAGVDIDAGNEAVRLMHGHVRSTFRPGVLTDIGGFGGLFALDTKKYREPVLVSGADGVGTKLKVAFLMDKHDTVGQDVVAMCVNDIIVSGAEPLFFLDYLAVGRLEPVKVAQIVAGVAAGCRLAGCALIGGETAEMPDFYPEGEYDLAGFALGVVNRDRIIDGRGIRTGDVVIGLASSGLHSNGFSLARKIFFQEAGWTTDKFIAELDGTLGEELLLPTRIYARAVQAAVAKVTIRGMAHITGGGLTENIARCLPAGTRAVIDRSTWQALPVFSLLEKLGKVPEREMFRTFNMGIGFVLIVEAASAGSTLEILKAAGESCSVIGQVSEGEGVEII